MELKANPVATGALAAGIVPAAPVALAPAALVALAAPAPASKVNRSVELPGIDLMRPDEDPSQFSHHVSEMALISALNALRFAQVVLIVVGTLFFFSRSRGVGC
jgi:hypothetical protein